MKPTIISPERKKKELFILLICFIAALIFNVFAIIKYNTQWKELITQLYIVIIITFGLYFILLFFRGLAWIIIKMFIKRNLK